MKKYFSILLLILIVNGLYAQEVDVATIGFYNLENLFDTIDTDDVRDTEFTPNGSRQWNSEKYHEKVDHIAFVLSKMGIDKNPEGLTMVGVAEIENRSVLEDLVGHTRLVDRQYEIIHYDSHDKRGIDVAFIYNPSRFTVVYSDTIHLPILRDGESWNTRDILYVKGVLDTDTIHVLVNHWPSRWGGEERSRAYREKGASICKAVVDSVYAVSPQDKFIVMGDLNDDPTSSSVKNYLNAKRKLKSVKKGGLYNPMANLFRRGIGSNAYRDKWSFFDQIIIGETLLDKKQNGYYFFKAKVFNKKFLLQKTGRYKGYPKRTYSGGKYTAGYSDHFPTLIYLYKNK